MFLFLCPCSWDYTCVPPPLATVVLLPGPSMVQQQNRVKSPQLSHLTVVLQLSKDNVLASYVIVNSLITLEGVRMSELTTDLLPQNNLVIPTHDPCAHENLKSNTQ